MRTLIILILFMNSFSARAAIRPQACERKPASINRAAQVLAAPSKILYNGETLIAADLIESYEKSKQEEVGINTQDYIPMTLKPTEDSGAVFSAIADKSLGTMLNQPEVRNSAFGRAATKVEKSLNQDVVLGSDQEIEHKLNFSVQAFQTQAQIRYEGLTKASLSYQASRSALAFEVYEELSSKNAQELVLSQEVNPDQRLSNISLRWNW